MVHVYTIIMSTAVIKVFSTESINTTAVQAMWFQVQNPYLDYYTVYYYPKLAQNGSRKRQNNERVAEFPADACFGVIGGLEEEQEFLFQLAVSITINEQTFEGQRTEPAPPGYKAYN